MLGPITSKGPEPRPFMGPPVPLPPGLPMPGVPRGAQLVPTRVWSEHVPHGGGRPYYYNKVTRQSVWEKPKDFELVMPLPANFGAIPAGPVAMSTPPMGASLNSSISSSSVPPPLRPPLQTSGQVPSPLLTMPPPVAAAVPGLSESDMIVVNCVGGLHWSLVSQRHLGKSGFLV